MARLIGPDEAVRTVYLPDGRARGQGLSVPLYADAALTTPADVRAVDGGTIAGTPPTLTVNAYSQIPLFQFPDGVDVVYTSVNGGPAVALYARTDERLDSLGARLGVLEPGGAGEAATLAYVQTAVAPVASAGQRSSIAAFSPLKRALEAGTQSVAVQVLGDSTGNDSDEWVAKWADQLAAAYPAWSVHRRLWSDTDQAYGQPTVVSTGTAGARYLDCTTGTAPRIIPAAASTHLSGVIDVRIKATLSTWITNPQAILVGRSDVAGARGWYLMINTTGNPAFVYSTDGTALVVRTATATTGIADGATSWLRAVFTPNDGAGNNTTAFYKSTDGVTWTQIGTTVTAAGAATVFNNTGVGYSIGGVGTGVAPVQPKVHEVWISAGGSSASVVPPLPDQWTRLNSSSAPIVGAPVLTVVNGSVPGANIAYLGDATRLPKMTPDFGQVLTVLSDSHNEGSKTGGYWVSTYDTWRSQVQSRLLGAPVVLVAQNPQTNAAVWYIEHAQRRADLIAYARAQRLPLIDVGAAFLAVSGWETSHMLDTVHPNPTGSALWANTVKASFDAANPAY